MEFFGKLMRLFGVGKPNVDPIANLPVEVTQCIFRKLDPHSLLNAARVSRGWRNVCRGDPRLRATARRFLRREKMLAYDLLRPVRKITRAIMRPSQKATTAAPPVVFTYGPSGASLGRAKPRNSGRNSGLLRAEPKRSMLKFR